MTMALDRKYAIALGFVVLVACRSGGDEGSEAADEVGTTDSSSSESESTTSETSTSTDTSDDTTSDTGDDPSQSCVELDLPIEPLREGTGSEWGEVAGDFTVETTFGTWTLSENFSGCDSYVFVQHVGDSTSDSLRNSFGVELFERSGPNVHYFFLSTDADPMAGALAWQTKIGQALAPLDDAQTDYWSQRVHFVTSAAGSVAEFLAAHPNLRALAIDRFQQWDDPGSTSDTGGGSFAQSGPVLGYVSRWYDFRHAQELALAEPQDVTEVAILDAVEFAPDCLEGSDCFDTQNGPFSNSNNYAIWPAEFPAAATMAGFDRMEVVVTSQCGPDSYADCGHWDYEAFVHLCADAECMGEKWEVLRWITPYSRPGTTKWVFEASPLLGLLAAGGTQHFQFGMRWNMNPATWDMKVRMWDSGSGAASKTVLPAFVGNDGFNDTYNDWPSFEFTPPPSTGRVELVALISGHGQDEGNCAEWCNHQHEFTVNGGTPHLREFPGQVGDQGCAAKVDEGVVPGQWGNWTPGRAGWCPGLPVQPWVVDITDEVQLGQLNTLDYRGLYAGAPVSGNKGRILLSSYVVYYE
ncbi:peptide-N-glycosidase F-related protein [Nannocystaceae bacterium ST9]